jgi:pre-rRNA-processing protein TSR4
MMAARVVKEVELGFVEEAEDPEQLTGPHFPSKVGGKPAWLDNAHLPLPEDTECGACRKPMTFLLQVLASYPGPLFSSSSKGLGTRLLQVYAPVPIDDSALEGDEYHRTRFVFMCRDPGCHSIGVSKSFKVLRCRVGEIVDCVSYLDEAGSLC